MYLITQTYPKAVLGDTSFIEQEIGILSKQYDITIICLGTKGEVVPMPSGVNCIFLSYRQNAVIRYLPFYFFDPICQRELREIVKNRSSARIFKMITASALMYANCRWFANQIKKRISKSESAIFYSFWADYPIIGLLRIKEWYSCCKFISRIHGYELYDEQDASGRVPFRQLLNEKIDKLIFIGANPLEYYLNHYPKLNSDKTVLCRLGIRPIIHERARRISDEMLLVSCSTLVPLKRVELIILALAEYTGKTPIHWIHFGDGPLIQQISRLSAEMLSAKELISYELKGCVENDVIRSFYAETIVDCFITTSSSEGCPVSVMEALAVGTPVIGTAVGDIPYMIDANGILLSSNPTIREIKGAIEQIAMTLAEKDVSNTYSRMRRQSEKLFSDLFDADKNTEHFITEIYQSIR